MVFSWKRYVVNIIVHWNKLSEYLCQYMCYFELQLFNFFSWSVMYGLIIMFYLNFCNPFNGKFQIQPSHGTILGVIQIGKPISLAWHPMLSSSALSLGIFLLLLYPFSQFLSHIFHIIHAFGIFFSHSYVNYICQGFLFSSGRCISGFKYSAGVNRVVVCAQRKI